MTKDEKTMKLYKALIKHCKETETECCLLVDAHEQHHIYWGISTWDAGGRMFANLGQALGTISKKEGCE